MSAQHGAACNASKYGTIMKFHSLQPFVPSGKDFQKSKSLFGALGFRVEWDAGNYVGFERDGCKFILQEFDLPSFAENLMLQVTIDNAENFWKEVVEQQLEERFGIRMAGPKQQPYGTEVVLIDLAGVCWHFVA